MGICSPKFNNLIGVALSSSRFSSASKSKPSPGAVGSGSRGASGAATINGVRRAPLVTLGGLADSMTVTPRPKSWRGRGGRPDYRKALGREYREKCKAPLDEPLDTPSLGALGLVPIPSVESRCPAILKVDKGL